MNLSIVRASDGAFAVAVEGGTVVSHEIRGVRAGAGAGNSAGLAFRSADLAFRGSAVLADHTSGATNATDRSIWVSADTGPESEQCAP